MTVANKATLIDGLIGNVAIPRQTGAGTGYWVAENAAPTESQQAVDQVLMTPHTFGAYTDFSRLLMVQSSINSEAFVRQDLAKVIALGIDQACINGSGTSGQPLGILNTSGVANPSLGANGGPLSWAALVELETAIAQANADIGNLAYITNTSVRGALKTTQKATGYPVYLWDTQSPDAPLNGYAAYASNQLPSTGTKGSGTNLSTMIFGNWNDLIVGMWGGLDVLIDPYTFSSSGTVRVRVLQDVDVAIRHPQSFAAFTDIVTS